MRPTHTIEELLGSRSRIAVLRVLHGVSVPLNASQIAVRARLTHPAASTVLAELASMGVVLNSPVGRATIHWLNRDSVYVRRLLDPLFEGERQVPNDLVEHLHEMFGEATISVVLFGSYARGDQTPESDVDVMLVAEDDLAKATLDSLAADHSGAFRLRFGSTLSCITYTRQEAVELARTSPQLAESIRNDGVVVSGSSPREWTKDGEAQ